MCNTTLETCGRLQRFVHKRRTANVDTTTEFDSNSIPIRDFRNRESFRLRFPIGQFRFRNLGKNESSFRERDTCFESRMSCRISSHGWGFHRTV
eukprot:1499770-Pyramimonas_sp.AAC.1